MLVKHTVVGFGMPHKENLHSSLFPCRSKSARPNAVGLITVSQEEGGQKQPAQSAHQLPPRRFPL